MLRTRPYGRPPAVLKPFTGLPRKPTVGAVIRKIAKAPRRPRFETVEKRFMMSQASLTLKQDGGGVATELPTPNLPSAVRDEKSLEEARNIIRDAKLHAAEKELQQLRKQREEDAKAKSEERHRRQLLAMRLEQQQRDAEREREMMRQQLIQTEKKNEDAKHVCMCLCNGVRFAYGGSNPFPIHQLARNLQKQIVSMNERQNELLDLHFEAAANAAPSASGASSPMKPPKPTEPKNLCRICYTNAIDTVMIKCGHAAMCLDCARKLPKKRPEEEMDYGGNPIRHQKKPKPALPQCPICRAYSRFKSLFLCE
jgi:hypothetical protein